MLEIELALRGVLIIAFFVVIVAVLIITSHKVHRRIAKKQIDAHAAEDTARLNYAMAVSNDNDRRNKLSQILPTYLTSEDRERRQEELSRLTKEYAESLLEAARNNNDSAAFFQLVTLVNTPIPRLESRSPDPQAETYGLLMLILAICNLSLPLYETRPYGSVTEYTWATTQFYAMPSDWNDLVALFYANPKLKKFNTMDLKWVTGDYRIKAAVALETKSVTLAKLVLAFANKKHSIQEELGSLATELARFVASADMNNKAERQAHPTN